MKIQHNGIHLEEHETNFFEAEILRILGSTASKVVTPTLNIA